jgi:hypothetical protein
MAKPQDKKQKGAGAGKSGSSTLVSAVYTSNPYPWMEDWYYELHKDEFAQFDAFVRGVLELGAARGFVIWTGQRTGPQYGSAGTVMFYAQCAAAGINSSRFVDDRLALSFGTDYARFLRWWLGTDTCALAIIPVPVPVPAPTGDRTVQYGRYVPRNPPRVCYLGLRLLFRL